MIIRLIRQRHFVFAVLFFPKHFHLLRNDRIDGFPRIIGLYRQLPAEPPVDEDTKLHFCRPAEIQQGIQRSPDRPTRPQHIIDEYNIPVLDGKRDIRLVQLMQPCSHIVPVKSDIQLPVMDATRFDLRLQLPDYPVGKIDPPRLYADQHGIFQVKMVLQ